MATKQISRMMGIGVTAILLLGIVGVPTTSGSDHQSAWNYVTEGNAPTCFGQQGLSIHTGGDGCEIQCAGTGLLCVVHVVDVVAGHVDFTWICTNQPKTGGASTSPATVPCTDGWVILRPQGPGWSDPPDSVPVSGTGFLSGSMTG